MNRKELIKYLKEYFDELIENEQAGNYKECLRGLEIDLSFEELQNG